MAKEQTTTYRAKWLIINPYKIIENGFLKVRKGIVVDVGKFNSKFKSENVKDFGESVILPKLINAHTHLELSILKEKFNGELDFLSWIKNLIKERDKFTKEELVISAKNELKKIKSTSFFCEISSLNITKNLFNDLHINGMFFLELLGSKFQSYKLHDNAFMQSSLACHAPHSSSPLLLQKVKNYTTKRNSLFSIHTAESEYETEFINNKSGSWACFLKERNVDFKNWEISEKSSVEYLEKLKILDDKTLLVHILEASEKDMEIIKKKGAKVCVCPRSNLFLHKKFPDICKMLKLNLKPALGTDSLASCETIDIFDEMAFIYKNYSDIKPEEIFEMATINGAKVFSCNNLGSLEKDTKAYFLNLKISENNKNKLIEKIINY